VFLWNPAQKQRWQLEPPQTAPITVLRWSPDDTTLAVGSANGEVSVWNVQERAGASQC
jgi:WD40 repeat protein